MPRTSVLPLLLVLPACDADFDVARGDLGPFRVAALGAREGADGGMVAAAAVWSGLGLYHEQAPTLSWTLDGEPLGEGWEVALPAAGELGLSATSPDGELREAKVQIAAPPPALTVSRGAWAPGDDLSLEARRAVEAEAVDGRAPEGEAARLALSFAEGAAAGGHAAHWMLAEGRGTLLGLDALSADLLAEEIGWDDGEIETREAVAPGFFPTLALVLDGAGSNRWIWADAVIGGEEALVRHEGRLLPLEQEDAESVIAAATQSGWLLATLVEREDVLGVGLAEATALAEVDGAPDLSAQDVLSCAPAGEPFRMAWVAEGRCARPDLLGARVVLEVW